MRSLFFWLSHGSYVGNAS